MEWMTKGQAMVLSINVIQYKGFVFRQQMPILWEKLCLYTSASGSYNWQADRLADDRRLDFKILEILHRLNYLDFHFVYSSAMLLIVLYVHFSLFLRQNIFVIGFGKT